MKGMVSFFGQRFWGGQRPIVPPHMANLPQLPLKPSQLPLRPSQLPLRPSQLALRHPFRPPPSLVALIIF